MVNKYYSCIRLISYQKIRKSPAKASGGVSGKASVYKKAEKDIQLKNENSDVQEHKTVNINGSYKILSSFRKLTL